MFNTKKHKQTNQTKTKKYKKVYYYILTDLVFQNLHCMLILYAGCEKKELKFFFVLKDLSLIC